MSEHEREQGAETPEQKAATLERGEDQEPKQADPEGSSRFWDTDQHSDAPGPFGTGDEQTVTEAAGSPEAEEPARPEAEEPGEDSTPG